MVSTLLGYRHYATDITKSMHRIEAMGSNKKDADYYAANIGKVKSVDDFLKNTRLYIYAMKAYGLEDQIASKGMMRKVLLSDISDPNSFANKLADKKYRTIAAAFNFPVLSDDKKKDAQTSTQEKRVVDSYDERRIRQGVEAARKTNYYQATIRTIGSVDELLDNSVLFDVVVSSIGADPTLVSKDYVKQALMGQLPATPALTNPKWLTLSQKFNFASMVNGVLLPGQPAQGASFVNETVYNYNVATDNNTNPAAAAFNTGYFTSQVVAGQSMTVDQLIDDKRLFEYVATAFGFDPSLELPEYFKAILSSDPSIGPANAYTRMMSDPKTTAARKEQFTHLRDVFNFDAHGNSKAGGAQTASQQQQLTEAYFKNYTAVTTSKDAKQTSSFKYLMLKINSVTDLLAANGPWGHDALNYALKAFDIDPKTTTLYEVRRVLTSDLSDPKSFVNKLKDERFVKFAAAFNFDGEGKAASPLLVQSTAAQAATGTKYKASFGEKPNKAQLDLIKTDTKAYLEAIQTLTSLDDFLADKKTLNYALKAYGLADKKLSITDIRKILTSDLGDRKSFAYSGEGETYVKFAQAFNFDPAGRITRETSDSQSGAAKLTTHNKFLLQALETKASEDGQEGVRLALYFRRMVPEVTSLTGILADKALMKVVMAALSLPDSFAQIGTDKQTALLERKLKLEDFKDPKKLDKFIARFSALYDVHNGAATTGASPILSLFNGGGAAAGGGLLSYL
ncbi:flagella associated protein [Aureimonas endophytica]|uniref:Flagella associated protein n=1 Tax=Aureimonas endophytica TaxID=2027858 RepID=A0A917EA35_9HYPH|nr:DUF1217 domain-containing protein [Aureimonas endophytica]GGE13969.1 flagella associated protein [Aureimonas endophytica]